MTEMTDFSGFKSIHFVGIGGVSMSALACIAKLRGCAVTGSDMQDSDAVEELRQDGIAVHVGHAAENIKGAELVVYTAAVKQDNPELAAARAAGIPTVERSAFLGYILSGYAFPIGVSGTHGKTTCTSMIAQALIAADVDPTVLIGGTLPLIGHNFRIGRSDKIVYEACEYVDSFLHFRSAVTVILNIEEDHLDYFKDLADIEKSFAAYADLTLPGGAVVANGDSEAVRRALKNHKGGIIWFSLKDPSCDYYAVPFKGPGCPRFEVYEGGKMQGVCQLSIPGLHNVANALAAIAACRRLDIPYGVLLPALASFGGACRRFEYKGRIGDVTVIDDYAHHPSEIKATLTAARTVYPGDIWCVFQPHTYSRTKALWNDFAGALTLCDHAVLLDIYAAREKPDPAVTSAGLAADIPGAVYCASFDDAKALLLSKLKPGDLLITMGAGNVYRLGEDMVEG
ncbi:MAG TPA: UDP-N-acetylmuramate--L-alanine ligase [Candidatus Acidoferrum sp.]|nr:UDP-N-acetylmuramate--L-alanine ligase [Candidatus Acidoferrum sp.]